MRHYHLTSNKYHRPAINLDRIWSLVSEQTRQNYKNKKDGPVPIIDVVRAVSSIVIGIFARPLRVLCTHSNFCFVECNFHQ